MNVQSGLADVNDTCLYYEVAGTGPPLVLIHGFTLDTRMWDDQFEAFSKHYRVVRYDMRGYGQSALPVLGEGYSHADDLRALLDHLGITKTHVIGLSMGGSVAVNFTIEYPERTMSLITVDTTLGGFPRSEEWRAFLGMIFSKARQAGVETSKKLFLNSELFQPALENPEVAARLAEMVLSYSGWSLLNPPGPEISLEIPAAKQLNKIDVPTLVIVGERDLPDFHDIADALDRGILKATKVVIPGVGHMANMEAPEKFNEVVLSFLSEINTCA